MVPVVALMMLCGVKVSKASCGRDGGWPSIKVISSGGWSLDIVSGTFAPTFIRGWTRKLILWLLPEEVKIEVLEKKDADLSISPDTESGV